jgi:transposase-like protein
MDHNYLLKIPSIFSPEFTDHARHLIEDHVNWILISELDAFIDEHQSVLPNGKLRLVRNGYMEPRMVVLQFGTIKIIQPRMEDRISGENKIKFHSKFIVPYKRISDAVVDNALDLYKKGLSTRSFKDVVMGLFGVSTKGFSASSIAKMTKGFYKKYNKWKNRNLSDKHYAYIYCDAAYFRIRGIKQKRCYLSVVGYTVEGIKDVIALSSCRSESSEEWKYLFTDLQKRGLQYDPNIVIGDEGPALWDAVSTKFPDAARQFCWEHKRRNLLKHFKSKENRDRVSQYYNAIYYAETKEESLKLINNFAKQFQKNTKAVDCLFRNLDNYLTYFDFPRNHWIHIKTSNPVESLFATLRLRVNKTRGMSSSVESLSGLLFVLAMDTEKNFQKITDLESLKKIVAGYKYENGKLSVEKIHNCSTDLAA